MSGLHLLQKIDAYIARGWGHEDICVKMDLTTRAQKRFVRNLVLNDAKREAA